MYDWKNVILTCSGSEINDFIIIIILNNKYVNKKLDKIALSSRVWPAFRLAEFRGGGHATKLGVTTFIYECAPLIANGTQRKLESV